MEIIDLNWKRYTAYTKIVPQILKINILMFALFSPWEYSHLLLFLNIFATPPLFYYSEPLILKYYDSECKLFSIKSDPQNQVQRGKMVCDRGETVKKRHPLTEKSQSGSSIATLGFGGSSLSFKDFII